LGPSKNGGIGTAYHALATALATAKHDVTILYLWAARSDPSEMRYWQTHFRAQGITFVPLPSRSSTIDLPDCMTIAWGAYSWLRGRNFDVVHFPELHGHAYYCVLAKHQGLDFDRATLCVGTHSPIAWVRERNREAPYSPDELEMEFMERQCVALADVVVSPSRYMLGWIQSHGWSLPANCYVQQNIAPPESRMVANPRRTQGSVQRASELVFFGRLEARKGIGLFCDVIDRIQGVNLPDFTVTFLGSNGRVAGRDGVSYIKERAKRWASPYRILSDYGHQAALRYLADDAGRLAIVPSFEDNLPNTVMECVAGRIPFLAGRGGGIPELIAHSDLEQVTFPPDPVQFADHIVRAIREGIPIARPAIDPDDNEQRWVNWHAAVASHHDRNHQASGHTVRPQAEPTVMVCLNYRGDPELLGQSVESLRRQTYSQFEVLLVDYSKEGADNELHHLTNEFTRKDWRLVKPEKLHGRAVETVAGPQAEYVLLMEAHDCLAPEALETFVKVATSISAEVLTSVLALFSGRQEPTEKSCLGHYPFLGGAIVSSIFRNYFGLRVIFIRKNTLLRLGGFPYNSRRDCADWEFLARAALQQCRIEVIPAPLAWYRISEESGPQVSIDYMDQVKALTPYAQAIPAELQELPKAAFTMGWQYRRMNQRLGDKAARAILERRPADRRQGKWDSILAHEGALLMAINQMPRRSRRQIASLLDGWLEYSSARAQLPPARFQRITHIMWQVVRGRYHRYGHGFGSAFRDLRKHSSLVQRRVED
jgi:glycosyltransferase involved in cell wall biosynthesis